MNQTATIMKAMATALSDLNDREASNTATQVTAARLIRAVVEDADEDVPAEAIGAAVAEVIGDYCSRAGQMDEPASDWLVEVLINQALDQLDPTGNA